MPMYISIHLYIYLLNCITIQLKLFHTNNFQLINIPDNFMNHNETYLIYFIGDDLYEDAVSVRPGSCHVGEGR